MNKPHRSAYPADLRDAGPVDFTPMLTVRIGDGYIDVARTEEEAEVQTMEQTEHPKLDYQQPSNASDQTTSISDGQQQPERKRIGDYAAEVMGLAYEGLTNVEIASALGLDTKQVKNFLYRRHQHARLAEVCQAPRQTAPQDAGQAFGAAPIQTYTPPTHDAPSSLAAAVVTEADRCAQVLQAVERAYGDGGVDVAKAAIRRLQAELGRLVGEVA